MCTCRSLIGNAVTYAWMLFCDIFCVAIIETPTRIKIQVLRTYSMLKHVFDFRVTVFQGHLRINIWLYLSNVPSTKGRLMLTNASLYWSVPCDEHKPFRPSNDCAVVTKIQRLAASAICNFWPNSGYPCSNDKLWPPPLLADGARGDPVPYG